MTDNELLMLAMGTNLGVLLMLAVHFVGQYVDAGRDLRAAEATLARQLKRHATDGWRDALAVRASAGGFAPIASHAYDGPGFLAPCTAGSYGAMCGETEYDHQERA